MTDLITIREVGPREGFQIQKRVFPVADKVKLINALSQTGVPEIEIVSFVRPDLLPQMADAKEVVASIQMAKGVMYHGLYLNQRGFKDAQSVVGLNNRGWLYGAASEAFLKKNSNLTTDALLGAIPGWLALFREYEMELHGVMISCAFGCSIEGKVGSKRLLALLDRFLTVLKDEEAVPAEIALADTVGMGNPAGVQEVVAELKARYPEIALSLHLHDTRGTGLANAYAGLCEGVSIFESSVGGLGGCPFTSGAAGNIATEDLVYMLHEMGYETGIDLDLYVHAARIAEEIIGAQLPGRYYRAVAKSG